MYALVALLSTIVAGTFVLAFVQRRRAWVPVFALALVHGIFTGTDTTRPWMWWSYVGTGMLVVFLVLVRGLTAGTRPMRPAASPNTGKHAPGASRPRPATAAPRSTPPRPDAQPASV
jgi:hypothetical protein